MKKIALFMLAAAASCTIKNDIDFPLVPGDITDFVVEHQLNADISKESRTVHVEVAESADLSRLELLRFSVSEDARCDDLTVGETLDLSKPLTVHVKTYQDYVWTIYATVQVHRNRRQRLGRPCSVHRPLRRLRQPWNLRMAQRR